MTALTGSCRRTLKILWLVRCPLFRMGMLIVVEDSPARITAVLLVAVKSAPAVALPSWVV